MNTQAERNLAPFAFGENLVRSMLGEDGNPWFVAKDIAKVLEIQNIRQSLSELDEDEKGVCITDTLGGPQEMTTISESGLYFLVFRSRKPQARAFSKWVRAEVLPTLRKTGTYTIPHSGKPRRYAMPDIPEMYALRPSMRQRLWQDALQTARLDNAGAEVAGEWFRELCRMMTAGYAPLSGAEGETRRILQFADERCQATEYGRINATLLYDTFAAWWCGKFDDPVPTQHIFGRVMSTRFAKRKRGGKSVYFGVSLNN